LIGVLALQGAFIEHVRALARLGVTTREVRQRKDLAGIDGLIIPGGESTTIGKLLDLLGMTEPVRELGRAGLPIWGTCAGLILLAREVGRPQTLLGLLDIGVRRNAFGAQLDSFEAALPIPVLGPDPFPADRPPRPRRDPAGDPARRHDRRRRTRQSARHRVPPRTDRGHAAACVFRGESGRVGQWASGPVGTRSTGVLASVLQRTLSPTGPLRPLAYGGPAMPGRRSKYSGIVVRWSQDE